MHLQQLKEIQRGQNWVCERGERGTTCQWRVCEKDAFTVQKMIYERVRGWTSGQSFPVQNFVEYPPRGIIAKWTWTVRFQETFTRLKPVSSVPYL